MGEMLVRHQPSSVAAVRHEIAADLAENGIGPERADNVTLVASELVSNAVRHADRSADGELDIVWTISAATVVVSVVDGSAAEPELRMPSADEPAGRGLAIVDRLATTWGVDHLRAGKRVWARVPIA